MKRSWLGWILLAIVCLALGIWCGNKFFDLFIKVSPLPPSEFQSSTARGYFITYGFVLGLVIFVVAMVTVAVAPLFRSSSGERSRSPQSP